MKGNRCLCLTLVLSLLAQVSMCQQFQLVRDIDSSTSSSPQSASFNTKWDVLPFRIVNNHAYFVAEDGTHGRELWRTDGTASGTQMVKDLFPGKQASSPQFLTSCNSLLFFVAHVNDSTGVFVTDGTSSGTRRVFSSTTYIQNLFAVDSLVYFSISGAIYRSDGTAAGTYLAIDLSGNYVEYITSIHGKLFFRASVFINGGYYPALWYSDGTPNNASVLSRDLVEPDGLTEGPGNSFYFTARDRTGNSGRKLCAGTVAPNVTAGLLGETMDITATDNAPTVYLNKGLYFIGTAPSDEKILYRYGAGENGGITRLKTLTPAGTRGVIERILPAGDHVFVSTACYQQDTSYQRQLWATDGSVPNTVMLKNNFEVTFMSVAGTELYFTGRDSTHGAEPWKSDGTIAGTTILKDIIPGNGSSFGGNGTCFARLNGQTILFTAFNGKGDELWTTDGTEAGTHLLKDINQITTAWGHYSLLSAYKNLVVFSTEESDEHIQRLWKSDGTVEGTLPVKNFVPASTFLNYTVPVRNDSVFAFGSDTTAIKQGLYTIDLKDRAPVLIRDFSHESGYFDWMDAAGKLLYFFSYQPFDHHWTLWRSDATSEGTFSLASGHDNNNIYNDESVPAVCGSALFFLKGDPDYRQLWRSDGTVAGTYRISGNDSLAFNAAPRYLTIYKGRLFFLANNRQNQLRIWTSDGTTKGTMELKGDYQGPANLTAAAGRLLFSAFTPDGAPALWSSDGQSEGTGIVTKLYPGSSSLTFRIFKRVGGLLFFFTTDDIHGNELWRTDGTAAGTVLVKNLTPNTKNPIYPNNYFLNPQVIAVGDKLCFVLQEELWISNGTSAGTKKIDDTGTQGIVSFSQLCGTASRLWFNGSSFDYGNELYMGAVAPSPLSHYTFTGNGRFDDPSNWLEGQVPPEDIFGGMEVIISPADGGVFILNQPLHFNGGKLIIAPGAKVQILGELIVQ